MTPEQKDAFVYRAFIRLFNSTQNSLILRIVLYCEVPAKQMLARYFKDVTEYVLTYDLALDGVVLIVKEQLPERETRINLKERLNHPMYCVLCLWMANYETLRSLGLLGIDRSYPKDLSIRVEC